MNQVGKLLNEVINQQSECYNEATRFKNRQISGCYEKKRRGNNTKMTIGLTYVSFGIKDL